MGIYLYRNAAAYIRQVALIVWYQVAYHYTLLWLTLLAGVLSILMVLISAFPLFQVLVVGYVPLPSWWPLGYQIAYGVGLLVLPYLVLILTYDLFASDRLHQLTDHLFPSVSILQYFTAKVLGSLFALLWMLFVIGFVLFVDAVRYSPFGATPGIIGLLGVLFIYSFCYMGIYVFISSIVRSARHCLYVCVLVAVSSIGLSVIPVISAYNPLSLGWSMFYDVSGSLIVLFGCGLLFLSLGLVSLIRRFS